MQPKGRLPEGVHSNGWGSIFLKLMFLSMWAERFRMQLLLAVRRGLLPIRFRPDFCPAAALGLRDSWWQAFLSDAWQVLTNRHPSLVDGPPSAERIFQASRQGFSSDQNRWAGCPRLACRRAEHSR